MKIFLTFLFVFFSTVNIEIENAWIRNSAEGMNTALFFDVVNNGTEPDTLYKVSSDLAELVQIHETVKDGDIMGMREVDFVVIKPNSTFNFKPMAHHIMLIKLKEDMKENAVGEAILYFKQAGEIKIKAPVKKMKR